MIRPDLIKSERTALVLIDCQVDFGAPEGKMARRGADVTGPMAAVGQTQILAAIARSAGVQLAFVRLLTPAGDQNPIPRQAKERRDVLPPDLCVEGTHGADFIGLQPRSGDIVVSKTRFSAFTRTGLAEQLHTQRIDTLILAGLTTECCIQSSAWAAFEQDFNVFIAQDACAAYEETMHRYAIHALKMSGATITTVSELADSWKNIV
jgi:ureidoacrylate peracid hydrolase